MGTDEETFNRVIELGHLLLRRGITVPDNDKTHHCYVLRERHADGKTYNYSMYVDEIYDLLVLFDFRPVTSVRAVASLSQSSRIDVITPCGFPVARLAQIFHGSGANLGNLYQLQEDNLARQIESLFKKAVQ